MKYTLERGSRKDFLEKFCWLSVAIAALSVIYLVLHLVRYLP